MKYILVLFVLLFFAGCVFDDGLRDDVERIVEETKEQEEQDEPE